MARIGLSDFAASNTTAHQRPRARTPRALTAEPEPLHLFYMLTSREDSAADERGSPGRTLFETESKIGPTRCNLAAPTEPNCPWARTQGGLTGCLS